MGKKEEIVQADTEDGQFLGETVVEAVENQIRDDDPPETRETLNRLMALGESKDNAMRYIARVFAIALFKILENEETYNEKRYLKNLNALPVLPFDEEER